MEWLGIILTVVGLNATVDREFPTQKKCLDYYKSITIEQAWCCEERKHFFGDDYTKPPLNIILPTPKSI